MALFGQMRSVNVFPEQQQSMGASVAGSPEALAEQAGAFKESTAATLAAAGAMGEPQATPKTPPGHGQNSQALQETANQLRDMVGIWGGLVPPADYTIGQMANRNTQAPQTNPVAFGAAMNQGQMSPTPVSQIPMGQPMGQATARPQGLLGPQPMRPGTIGPMRPGTRR